MIADTLPAIPESAPATRNRRPRGQNKLYVVKELQICKFEDPRGGARRKING